MRVADDTALWVDDYLEQLRVERALAKNTLEAYSHDLAEFVTSLERKNCALFEVTAENIAEFLKALTDRGVSPRSQARYVSSLRGFFRYLRASRHIAVDPTELLES